MSLTPKEKRLAVQCKYLHGGNVTWLAKRLKASRIKAYVVLAKYYLDEDVKE